ncbi:MULTISPECIES: SDR family oxidoreductase [unclassified Aureimonas]|uniref:SDR family oxidoreductase n=1 Tax=unclassified Aureimonas TaxID=2615206 RepID=UPI0007090F18|nr:MULTISPECIES: NAD(P)-dependent oxidoreductase [unclassified Aureimonas]KQT64181.1 hypothetical protein ASG62_04100 [Aureimonas sp. Leaf427]
MRVLVAGGKGRLGRALSLAGGPAVQGLSRSDLDITEASAFQAALERLRPDAVINAAIVGVDASDADPERARLVNAIAPGHLAQACRRAGVPFIHISTDYVFGGEPDRLRRESDPVSPVNAYGRVKADGEAHVLDAGPGTCIARVAWLFGDRQDFIARLLQGGSDTVRVTHDQVGSPTPILAVAERLLDLAARMAAGDAIPPILHLAGSPAVSRADWVATAFAAIEAAGRRAPTLRRVSMAEFGDAVARPRYTALDGTLAGALFGGPLDWRPLTLRADTFCDEALPGRS